jgi:hypothetical protein
MRLWSKARLVLSEREVALQIILILLYFGALKLTIVALRRHLLEKKSYVYV